jgi:hypothetical protein
MALLLGPVYSFRAFFARKEGVVSAAFVFNRLPENLSASKPVGGGHPFG